MTYSCNRIERLIWLNYKKTLGTIVIKRKLYIYSSFGVKAEEERNRAYEEKNESSLVSGSVTISRAGSVPGYGSTGMAQENSSWVYYDSNGNKVYNNGKRELTASGDTERRRYMAVNAWADSDYYVDSNGIMVTDKWLKTTSDGGEEEWYYFGSSGKTIDDTWKKINDKWYHFDGNGRMETGWILDDMYYTGDDGVMRTGWQKLYPPDNYEEDSNKSDPGS